MSKKVAMIIAFTDFKDEEYFIPKEILEKAGIEVMTVSNSEGIAQGVGGGETEVDISINELETENYDGLIFVGGPGCLENLDNESSYKIARGAVNQNKVLAAICISPVILAKAGVLKGKKATVWSSLLDKRSIKILQENGVDYQENDLVIDEKIITASGPAVAEEFGQAIVKALTP
jgi:protease I